MSDNNNKRKRAGHQGNKAPLSDKAWRVLILGDGNFSFSLELSKRLPQSTMVCTSFDKAQELDKYVDANSILGRLEALGSRIYIVHEVDAMNIMGTLFKSNGLQPLPKSFDHIIFNHPHTGWEDLHRHASLLSHFIESCKAVLAKGGLVHISLASDQHERWNLGKSAHRLGYKLIHLSDFFRLFGPNPMPSEIKRHQSGKSFRLRGLPSTTFTLALARDDKDRKAGEMVDVPWRHSYPLPCSSDGEKKEEKGGAGGLVMVPSLASLIKSVAAGQGGEGGEDSTINGGGAPILDVAKIFKCETCSKKFRGPKDLRKHVADSHQGEGGGGGGVNDDEWICERCEGGRRFKDQEALDQHVRSKHGKHQEIKPDWSQARRRPEGDQQGEGGETSSTTTAKQDCHFRGIEREAGGLDDETAAVQGLVLCTVCDYYVASSSSDYFMEDHLADLRPPERPVFRCEGCDRVFHEDRALKQHQNCCKIGNLPT